MALEPVENRVLPLTPGSSYLLKWRVHKGWLRIWIRLWGLEDRLKRQLGITASLKVRNGLVELTILLPQSRYGYTDDQIKGFIGSVETLVEQRLRLHPESDKSIE